MAAVIEKLPVEIRNTLPWTPKWVDQVSLGAGTAGSYTVPADVTSVVIGYTAGVLYGRFDGGTAVVPAAAITNGTGSAVIMQGDSFRVSPGDVLSFINATECFVTIAPRREN